MRISVCGASSVISVYCIDGGHSYLFYRFAGTQEGVTGFIEG